MLVISATQDIKTSLNSVNGNAEYEQNELKLLEKVYGTLEFHSTVKRLDKFVVNFFHSFHSNRGENF